MTGSPETHAPAPKERRKPGRVPTSCAECRRLKLRCDRKVPCENCLKRGCGAICPTGSLTMGKGNRLILTGTTELHNKIELMSARIRELEEALRLARPQTSDDPPMSFSSTTSPTSRNGTEKMHPDVGTSDSREPEPDSFIDAFGTLSIGTHGDTTFVGGTARAEYLMRHPPEKASPWATLIQNSRLPQSIINASAFEHGIPPAGEQLQELVMCHRPPLSEAIRLCEIYLNWAKTLWIPLRRCELLEDVVGSVYRADTYESIPGPHTLSLLFSILALASLFDFSRPPFAIEAYEYYILSRVALQFNSPCITSTLETVHTLINNLTWLDLSDSLADLSRPYILAGLGVKIAYRMGLHLHSARFQLERGVIQKRSTLFWQMFLMDTILSFFAGRPSNVSLDWIDAPFPDDEFPMNNDKGEPEMGWRYWSWGFGKLVHQVLTTAFGTKIPTYGTILELDRKIRDYPVPSHLQLCIKDIRAEPQVVLQQYLVLTYKESILLNIHRRFFSQALQDCPSNPLKHKYGPSVMAMYRSAWRSIVSLSSAVDCFPEIAMRVPIIWSQALSAAIAMCMLVTRAPTSSMAASSLHEVDVVYEVFKKAAPTTRIASVFLEHVEKIWYKSHENTYPPCSQCTLTKEELDRVGGGSTSLISKVANAPSPSSGHSATSSPPTTYSTPSNVTNLSCASSSSFDLPSSSIHPRIVQDMQSFDGFQVPSTATGGFDYATPEQFSQSLIDTQFNEFCVSSDVCPTQASNAFHPARTSFQLPNEMHPTESPQLNPAWQNFMEQLGF